MVAVLWLFLRLHSVVLKGFLVGRGALEGYLRLFGVVLLDQVCLLRLRFEIIVALLDKLRLVAGLALKFSGLGLVDIGWLWLRLHLHK